METRVQAVCERIIRWAPRSARSGHPASTLRCYKTGVKCAWHFFFFSSRRRHTRFDCDWSSDVCSSDLSSLSLSSDGKRMALLQAALDRPPEVFALEPKAARDPRNISQANAKLLAELDLDRKSVV